jgi:uncharacterized protein YndB with AHSA1/START domain
MSTATNPTITVNAIVNAPVDKVWNTWSQPEHIVKWNSASEDWHTPKAENDLRTGGKFSSRMEAKDGSWGFDFAGVYDFVEPQKVIKYRMADGRSVKVIFTANGDTTEVVEEFDPESENSVDMQREGWQAILNNFKKYTESL